MKDRYDNRVKFLKERRVYDKFCRNYYAEESRPVDEFLSKKDYGTGIKNGTTFIKCAFLWPFDELLLWKGLNTEYLQLIQED